MELIVIVLSSMSGALIGTSVGIFLMYRRLRPISNAELDGLRGKLRSTEFSLNAATGNMENMKKLIAEREQSLQQLTEELKAKDQQLEIAAHEKQEYTAQRAEAATKLTDRLAEADDRIRELTADADALRAQRAELEGRLREEKAQVNDKAVQGLAAAEAQVAASEKQIQELTEQVSSLNVEATELRHSWEQELRGRSTLQSQLDEQRQLVQQLSTQVAELQAERAQFDVRLVEERSQAAKSIEMLMAAQENLAKVFKTVGVQPPGNGNGNGTNGHVAEPEAAEQAAAVAQPVQPATPAPAPVEAAEELQPAVATAE